MKLIKNTVANCIFVKDSKVLLEKRKKDEDNYAGLWSFPGGHKEKNEGIEQTLLREMKEELGIDVVYYLLIDKFEDTDPTSKERYRHYVFLCRKWKGRIKETAEEEGIRWIELNNLNRLKNKSRILTRAKKYLDNKNSPLGAIRRLKPQRGTRNAKHFSVSAVLRSSQLASFWD